MAPNKKRDVSTEGGPPAKTQKISSKRAGHMLACLESEMQQSRVKEQRDYVLQEMLLCASTADQCYALALKIQKKRDNEQQLHRNMVLLGGVPGFHKENAVARYRCFRKPCWTGVCQDKRQLDQVFYWLTGFSCTSYWCRAAPS